MIETNKLIDDQFKTLPEELKQAITLSSWKTTVQEIGKSKGLTPDQITSLETETMLVIYDLEDAEDFIENLIAELQLDNEKASMVANEINLKVFQPIITKAGSITEPTLKNPEPAVMPPSNLPIGGTVVSDEGKITLVPTVEVQKLPTPEPTVPPVVPAPVMPPQPAPVPTTKPITPIAARYPGGHDPYREPI